MKAILQTKSGPPEVLQLREVEKPAPGDNEILVKVRAATVTIGDVIIRKIPRMILLPLGALFGFKAKRITGHEFAGDVVEIGKGIKRFKVGDQVFGTTSGLSNGANAEYVCIPEEWKQGVVALKPTNMTYEEAAAVPIGGMTALQILKIGNIKKGHKVLVYGASGSVGTFAVQLAKSYGADVTGVCGTTNVEMMRSLGVDRVIDYKKEDFTQSNQTYDVIFDAVRKIQYSSCKIFLKEGGIFLSARSPTREETVYLITLKELIEAGKIRTVIDRCYSLEQTSEAHHYVEKGHKKGNVVITVGEYN